MRTPLLLSLLFIILVSFQQQKDHTLTHESIQLTTDSIFSRLVKVRRDIHENPELAGKEERTQQVIKQYLLDLGLQVRTDIYGHSVLGILNGGKKGKKIAWRADMDAISNNFPDKMDFRSKVKGVQHGCGHDIHIAIGLGIADVLAKHKASVNGTVYFIFQPAEETFVGAKGMVDSGLFDKIKPDEIYGLHITPMSVGQITVKPNEMYAHQRRVRIKLKDKLSDEEVKALTDKISSAMVRVQPGGKPWDLKYLLDPQVGPGNPNTFFKDYLFMAENSTKHAGNDELFLDASFYETNPDNIQNIIPTVRQVVEQSGFGDKLLSVSMIQENPTVANDEKLTTAAINTIKRIYGNNAVLADYGQVPYSNDDFAYFQQKVPGVYFFLGGSNFEKGIIARNHAPNFQVDEESIRVGVQRFTSLIFERLKN